MGCGRSRPVSPRRRPRGPVPGRALEGPWCELSAALERMRGGAVSGRGRYHRPPNGSLGASHAYTFPLSVPT